MTAQTLKPGEFRAVCQRGHELETFADRDAFEAHMTGHGAKKLNPGGPHFAGDRNAPERMGRVVTCEHEGAHHSDDTVTVFRGRPAPETLCGYHASQIA